MATILERRVDTGVPEAAASNTAAARYFLGADFWQDFAWALSIFLTGLGAKLFLIHGFGTSMPFFDQWDGQAGQIYLPWLAGHVPLEHWFHPHNEHRIFFTRIYDLALFVLNGQWDSRWQMVCNAAVHCGALAGLGWFMARLLGRNMWPLLWLPLVLALGLPFGWENTLAGFQSQFYFLLIFSLLTLWLLGFGTPYSWQWWSGVLCAAASLFTTGSGMFAAAAVTGMIALDCLRERRFVRRHLPTLVVCVLTGVAGILLRHEVPATAFMKAHSFGEFYLALRRNLAWPRFRRLNRALWNVLPLVYLAGVYLWSRRKELPAARLILGIGGWVFLQALATAYARGMDGRAPFSRYMDSSSFAMITASLAFICLLVHYRGRMWLRGMTMIFFALWAVDCMVGLGQLNEIAFDEEIPERAYEQRLWLKSTRAFLATDDVRVFHGKVVIEMPYPDPEKLAKWLRNPVVRGILPACVREPLRLVAKDDGTLTRTNEAVFRAHLPAGTSWVSQPGTNGVAGDGRWESLPAGPSALPYLEFPVSGDFADAGVSLELVDLATGKATRIKPEPAATGPWPLARVKAPAGKFKVVAENRSATAGFAFKEPRELGRFSFWTVKLLDGWNYFIWAGLGCLGLSVVWLAVRRRED
jgi:hypothetical protein